MLRGGRPTWPCSSTRPGVAVLLDDRKASPGVKFADAEIMGMPTIVVVGRGLADGRDRAAGPAHRRAAATSPVDDALGEIVAAVHGRPALSSDRPRPGPLPSAHPGAAGAGRLRGRLGGRGGGRRRADPAAGAADRAARPHPAGRDPRHQQGLARSGARRPARSPTRSRSSPTGGRSSRWSSPPPVGSALGAQLARFLPRELLHPDRADRPGRWSGSTPGGGPSSG